MLSLAVLLGLQFLSSAAEPDRVPVEAVRPQLAPRYHLKYKFSPGQDIYYQSNLKTRMTTQKGEAAETTKNESNTLKHLRVISVDADGRTVLESYLDRVKMSYQFDQNPVIEFNSDLKTTPRGFKEIRESIGRPLSRTTVEQNGRLKDVISLAEKRDKNSKATSDDPARNFLYELPSEPIAAGTEWTERLPVKVNVSKGLSQTLTLIRKFKLESVEKNLATVSVRCDVLTPTDDPHILAQLIQRTPRGSFVFDLDQGLIVSRTMVTNKTEVGVMGANSSMRASSDLNETLTRGPVVAEKISLNNSPKAIATE